MSLAVELTDFSVYYTQGLVDAITADMKAGKSEVVCDAGRLIKVSRDKDGIVTQDVLTKHWTDWIDYWAVDFDYQSRREIIRQPKNLGVEGSAGMADTGQFIEFEDVWHGGYIFERMAELPHPPRPHPGPDQRAAHLREARQLHRGREGVDIFGNDTMSLTAVNIV